jgi:NAD(P)-dependent dehydrogenase (short-subunit alcohol dehydrogenase family)
MTDPASIFAPELFRGRVAIVTGGATGIGLAIAEELARLGARVVIASRKTGRLGTAARGLSAQYGAEVEAIPCDIRKREQVDALFDAALARFGRIDFVVNNGGGQFLARAEAIREKGWQAVIDTNLSGTFHMCQAAALKWMQAHGGKIVNIVADIWRGFPGMVHTGAARAGVVNMTKTLAIEWAEHGIRINCVAPGVILTTGMHNYPPGTVEQVVRRIPVKRLGRAQEVAWAVLFLLSPAGDFITGTTLRVDGGASLWGDSWQIPDPAQPPELRIPQWPEERWPEHAAKAGDDGDENAG